MSLGGRGASELVEAKPWRVRQSECPGFVQRTPPTGRSHDEFLRKKVQRKCDYHSGGHPQLQATKTSRPPRGFDESRPFPAARPARVNWEAGYFGFSALRRDPDAMLLPSLAHLDFVPVDVFVSIWMILDRANRTEIEKKARIRQKKKGKHSKGKKSSFLLRLLSPLKVTHERLRG